MAKCSVSDQVSCGVVINDSSWCPPQVRSLLTRYPSLTAPSNVNRTAQSPRDSDVRHSINTGSAAPTFSAPRRLNQERHLAAKRVFDQLLQQGFVRASNSAWAAPLHLVAKKTPGEWRVTGDYRSLNLITTPDRYPLPHMQELSARIGGKTIFSKLDLVKAYYNVPMAPEDIPKTAVTTPFGLFEYLFLPMGLRNSSATFQRFMDGIFRSLSCVFVYLDDILVFSDDKQKHVEDLEAVCAVLHQNNLRLALEKCEFFVEQVEFLGHQVSARGICPPADRVAAIKDFPRPKDHAGLRRFLGMIGFYRRMVPRFADVVFPLSEMLRLQSAKEPLIWTDHTNQAFSDVKEALTNACTLSGLFPGSSEFHLVSDCSAHAAGAALHQLVNGVPHVVSFFSKKLSEQQQKYSTFDRELLAAYLAVLHFRHIIQGGRPTLFTDHKPLVGAFSSQKPAKLDRQTAPSVGPD